MGSISAGWNYQQSNAWYDIYTPLPKLPDGRQVDDSAYKRLAWFHRGLDLVAEHPLGFGYGRDAFGLALLHEGYKTYPSTNAHSGIIDLGIRLGMPGILLWTAYCLALVVVGYRAFATRGDVLGLVLLLLSCGYMGRMMIESIQRDHMLYLFLFISAGLLAEIAAKRETPASA
jgi:O-antigen ligase